MYFRLYGSYHYDNFHYYDVLDLYNILHRRNSVNVIAIDTYDDDRQTGYFAVVT